MKSAFTRHVVLFCAELLLRCGIGFPGVPDPEPGREPHGTTKGTLRSSARDAFFFFGGAKSLFWGIQKSFWDTKVFLGDTKVFLGGYKKIVLDIFGCHKGLINCLIVLDILEGQKRQGWVFWQPRSGSKSRTNNRKSKTCMQKKKSSSNIRKKSTSNAPGQFLMED